MTSYCLKPQWFRNKSKTVIVLRSPFQCPDLAVYRRQHSGWKHRFWSDCRLSSLTKLTMWSFRKGLHSRTCTAHLMRLFWSTDHLTHRPHCVGVLDDKMAIWLCPQRRRCAPRLFYRSDWFKSPRYVGVTKGTVLSQLLLQQGVLMTQQMTTSHWSLSGSLNTLSALSCKVTYNHYSAITTLYLRMMDEDVKRGALTEP